ncbi:hypothetical protein LCGC14_2660710, partial [marine sediment metagenome]
MWLFLPIGFYSIVCPRENAGRGPDVDTTKVMIRARVREHLEALRKRLSANAQPKIIESPHADYPYRLIVPKAAWTAALSELIAEQEYVNFKNT